MRRASRSAKGKRRGVRTHKFKRPEAESHDGRARRSKFPALALRCTARMTSRSLTARGHCANLPSISLVISLEMKFKGNLVDPTAVLNVLSALEKLGNACIMNLSKTKIDFFMSKEFTKGDECFVDVTMSSVFENISISSLNDDQIPLHIDIGNLMRAVRSATSAVACTVKLTKKMAQPCLTFELQRSQHDHSITIQVSLMYQAARRVVQSLLS